MRFVALLAIIGLLLFQAGPPVDITPWSQLELTLNQLGARQINYYGYCFLAEGDPFISSLQQLVNQSRPPQWQARLLFEDSGNSLPGAEAVWALQVTGNDYRACWKALQQAGQFDSRKQPGSPVVWMTEAFLNGDPSDLPRLAEELLAGLEGKLHSVYRDELTINLLAYVPGFTPQLIIEEIPVNLNLELRYNRNLELIRIRLGVPLLISNLKV